MKRLFMGGLADGEWIDVPADREFWRVAADSARGSAKPIDVPADREFWRVAADSARGSAKPMAGEMSFEIVEYRKFFLRGHSYTFNIMAVEGMDLDSVIGSLIRGCLAFRTDKTEELLVDPKKLDADNILDRMAAQ